MDNNENPTFIIHEKPTLKDEAQSAAVQVGAALATTALTLVAIIVVGKVLAYRADKKAAKLAATTEAPTE